MCRILTLKGTNTEKAQKYVEALFRVWAKDPDLQSAVDYFSVSGLSCQHIHGWGYILVTSDGILHYANGKFFLEDEIGRKRLLQALSEIEGEFLLMVELRVTDEWYVSAFNAHPFAFQSRNGYEGFLFYNGLLDYGKLGELEDVDMSNYTTKNGTTVMTISIAKALEAGKNIHDAIQEPRKALRSSYNLMLFYRDSDGKFKAYVMAYVTDTILNNPEVVAYYQLVKREEEDISVIGSAALRAYLSETFTTLENGESIELDIDFIHETYFDGNQK